MIASLKQELLQKLVELSNFYPDMRFGQLVCYATSMAGDTTPGLIDEVEDEAVLREVSEHLTRRARQLETELNGTLSAWPSVRVELLRALEQLSDRYPEWPLGQMVFKLAALAHLNVYDIEDEQLLEAARSTTPGIEWFKWYTRKLKRESTICDRRDEQSYRCPCCRHRTLQERGGFEICPVCYWEDDGQDDADADTVRGGPNGTLSLSRARDNYRRHGVCDPKFIEHVRPPRPQEL